MARHYHHDHELSDHCSVTARGSTHRLPPWDLLLAGGHQKKLYAKVKWSCDPLSHDVLAHHAQRTNYILFNVGIGTCLNVGASSQLVRMRLRWPNFDLP
jgi:hypothetical protein